MSEPGVEVELLRRFEDGLLPRFPERSEIPAAVLGYGEISTVLDIPSIHEGSLAYKRMPMFRTESEADDYEALYRNYLEVLGDRVGIRVVRGDALRLVDEKRGRVVVYIIQPKLEAASVGHRIIHHLSASDVRRLVDAVLTQASQAFEFNRQHQGEIEVGLDAQISNWAIAESGAHEKGLGEQVQLVYFDTSTPFIREKGVERLNPELFLRSAPSFLVWILRLLFLKDVMTRYYDFRKVLIDLAANFYKEQLPGLVPEVVDTINQFLARGGPGEGLPAITVNEVRAYYREDAWIWRSYLAFRKMDRALYGLLGKPYPYILPEKIKR